MIELSYHLSEGEYLKAMRSMGVGKRFIIYFLIALLFLFLNSIMVEGEYWLTAITWTLPLVLIFGLWIGLIFWSFKRSYRKTPFSKGKVFYGFSEAEIEFSSAHSEGTLKWGAFQKVKETKAFYFLFTSNVTAIIIPKRVFESAVEQDAFRNLLRTKSLLKA